MRSLVVKGHEGRTKLISVLALLFGVMIVLEIVIDTQVLMPSFAELERDDARTSMRRVDSAFTSALDNLDLSAADWGNWSDVYHFVASPSAEFVKENITAEALKQLQVSTLMIVDPDGNVVAADSRDVVSGQPIDLDLAAAKTLPANFPWRRNLVSGATSQGLVSTNLGIMMLAAAPVLDGSGVQLAIDDFGTGYSSFGRLSHFAVDRLKIDQSFISSLMDCSDDRAIAAAIIVMSRSLRINVTAEGVESFPQLLFLQAHECQEAQGVLFSRALPPADARKLLRRAAEAGEGSRTQRLRHLIG